MGLTRALPAGLLDAGSAALATFASGVYAANYYDRESGELGVFALFFAIFLVAAIVPFKFAFLPGEVRLLSLPKAQQLGGFRLTLPAGVPVALAGSLVVLLALIPAGDAGSSLLIPLAVTTVIAAFLSPIQDHVRRVMHQAGRSWLAATTSIVQLTVALAAIGVAIAADIDRSWVPFGALVVANTVSTTVGLALALRNSRPARGERYRLRSLGVSGRWLTGFGLLPVGATFVAASIVALIAGKDILGSAEAARVAGRPVLVFVAGVAAVMNPPSLIAGRDRNRAEGARLSGIASKVMLVFGAAMFLWMGFDWVGNPMVWLVEEAYTVEFLTAATILTNTFWSMWFSDESQLIGGGREVDIFRVFLLAAVAQIAVAFTAPVTESFAVPLSMLSFGIVRWFGYRWSLRRLYAEPPRPPAETNPADQRLSAG
ncbi:MAG: hypothetical protein OEP52_03525 [Acidimicrobiia bacterium]|nr:hypothetical protein [Acidimicrobiia bacterium]